MKDAPKLDDTQLHDHVPVIIDDLIRVLEASEASEACGQILGSNQGAKEHAQQRLKKGFPLDEALREFSHFRIALIDLCAQTGTRLVGDIAELVHATLDENMITGASEMERGRRADLQEQAMFRERFIGILGHDLRTPLHAIGLALELLLQDEGLTDEQRAILHRATTSAARMDRMIHDLLDLSRARLGQGIPLDRKPTDIAAICKQVVNELSLVHPTRRIEIDTPPGVPGSYDPDRLAQVVSNLIGNALKYSSTDTPVKIVLREPHDEVVLSIHNHGPEIPPDSVPHLFDPFWQGAPKTKASMDESLGLGLFIVHAIVAAHGGKVDVVSHPDDGTTFTVRLPRRT